MKHAVVLFSVTCAVLSAQRIVLAQEGREPVPQQPAVAPIAQPPTLTETERAEYLSRDAEGRWAYLSQLRLGEAQPAEAWARFLAEQRDFELMERLSLYSSIFCAQRMRDGLFRADAPQCLRVAAWHLGFGDSHQRTAARGALAGKPAETLGWLELYPEIRKGQLKQLYDELRTKGVVAADASRYLPPFDGRDVFGELRTLSRVQLVDFGDRKTAQPGQRYVHEVTRTIAALNTRMHRPDYVHDWLMELVRHENPDVRQAVMLAYTHFGPGEIPVDLLWSIVQDPTEEDRLREAALLGLSYALDHHVYGKLLAVYQVPRHPAWPAAASRLMELDMGFVTTLEVDVPEDRRAMWERVVTTLRGRMNGSDDDWWTAHVQRLLERAAVARLTQAPYADDLVAWTVAHLRAKDGPGVQGLLERYRASYEPSPGFDPEPWSARLQAEVRELAAASLR